MAPIARRYALALFAILVRPWTWLMLAFGLLYLIPLALVWSRGEIARLDTSLVPVPVVDEPPAAYGRNIGELARAGRLPSIREWNTRWSPVHLAVDGRVVLSTPDEPPGACPLLDHLPALERLWMAPPDMLSERGWQRIAAHRSLEVLSLVDVGSPDPGTRARFPSLAKEALEQLPSLRQLDLRGAGGSFDVELPSLPALEVCGLGWGRLEGNLRTLADHSPRLRALGLEIPDRFTVTPAMIESLRRMPALRVLSLAVSTRVDDEQAMLRRIADLRRVLPRVSVVPGTFRPARIWTVFVTSLLAIFVPFVFWFMAGVLLSTPSSWMLPRRLAPHLFWPMAASAAAGGMVVGAARSMGAAWMPSLALALLAAGLGAYGAFARDLPGREQRVTGAITRLDVGGALLVAALVLLGRPLFDRWLLGMFPALDVLLVIAGVAGLAWKIGRLGRIPRILAEQGLATIPGLSFDPMTTLPRERNERAHGGPWGGGAWWLSDVVIDRQIAAPPPPDPTRAAGFADMLRRQQSRLQIPLAVVTMFVALAGTLLLLPRFFPLGDAAAESRGLSLPPAVLAMCAWQGAILGVGLTATHWSRRRASLVVDFLRPVSRRDYWLGLRRAIACDLVLPTVLGGGAMALAVAWYGGGRWLPWAISAAVIVGVVALVHAMILALATTKWPLVMGTVSGFLFLGVAAASAVGFVHAMLALQPQHVRTAWLAAGAVLAVGAGVRTAVLRGLDARELG